MAPHYYIFYLHDIPCDVKTRKNGDKSESGFRGIAKMTGKKINDRIKI